MSRHAWYRKAGLLLVLIATPALAAEPADKPAEVTGDWEITVETPVGSFTSKATFESKDGMLTGRNVSMNGNETKLNNVKLTGKTLSFDQDIMFQGMPLHLVYTGTLEDMAIKGTFEANGQTMNWSAKRPSAAPSAALQPSGPAGTWKLSVETPNGSQERTLILKQAGDKLTGTITGPMGTEMALQDVALNGKELRFAVSFERNGATVKRSYVAILDGNSIKGSIEGGTQARSFTGKREPVPGEKLTLAGTWKLSVETPEETHHPMLILVEQDGKYSGKLVVMSGTECMLKDMVVKGSELAFAVDLKVGDQDLHLKFTGTVDGDKLKGSIDNGSGQSYVTTGERDAKS